MLSVWAFDERCSVSYTEYDSCLTSNDLLRRLVAKLSVTAMSCRPIAQSAGGVPNIENAPAISAGPYLLESGQVTAFTWHDRELRTSEHLTVILSVLNLGTACGRMNMLCPCDRNWSCCLTDVNDRFL
jgi:hypothetical protein